MTVETEAAPRPSGRSTHGLAGLLVIDKPPGRTSHDLVDRVRRRLHVRQAGHLGTLDPAASGLLMIAVGAATRCASVWQGGEKTYEATLRFGVVTRTQDTTGEVIEERPVDLDDARVREASRAFVGEIDQIPPMVSALKVQGQRLYRLARRGIEVERAPRRIRVIEWEWLGFSLPEATFRVRCSGGTYVRTLAHDLGERLGPGAALRSLRRLRSEPFGLERAVTLVDLDTIDAAALWEKGGIELEDALRVLPAVVVGAGDLDPIGHGIAVPIDASAVRPPRTVDTEPHSGSWSPPIAGGPRSVVLLGPDGTALGLGELRDGSHGAPSLVASPHVVFPWASRQGRA